MYEVIVVGAGPAGSTAAKYLAEAGNNVLLVDKNKFPRDKPCGGGIPDRVLKKFPYLRNREIIDSDTYGGYLYTSTLTNRALISRDTPILAMIRRSTFDQKLVNLAMDSGALFQENIAIKSLIFSQDYVELILQNGSHLKSKVIIGADGIWSTVVKSIGNGRNNPHFGFALFQEFPVGQETLDHYFTERRFCHVHLNYLGIVGYGWVFPKKEHINIGIIEMKKQNRPGKNESSLRDIYQHYLTMLKEQNIVPSSLSLEILKGAAIPNHPQKKTFADHVLICGDAAGFIQPFSGEGIDYAMTSGKLAAQVVTSALEKGNTHASSLSIYEKIWKHEFGRNINLFWFLMNHWGNKMDMIVPFINSDRQISDLVVDLANQSSLPQKKWMVLRRFLKYKFLEYVRN